MTAKEKLIAEVTVLLRNATLESVAFVYDALSRTSPAKPETKTAAPKAPAKAKAPTKSMLPAGKGVERIVTVVAKNPGNTLAWITKKSGFTRAQAEYFITKALKDNLVNKSPEKTYSCAGAQ